MKVKDRELIKLVNSRFKDAVWVKNAADVNIVVGGAGGIGSAVIFLLSRLGYSLTIYDNDVVGAENIGIQMFHRNSVGTSKTSAIQSACQGFISDSTRINCMTELFTETSMASGIMISCFDNMTARKTMFTVFKNYVTTLPIETRQKTILIDGRLEAETLQIYTCNGTEESLKRYEDTLFDDSVLPDLPCTFKSTPHNSFLIAGMITSIVTNFLYNIYVNKNIRTIPFEITFQIPMLYFSLTE